MALFELNDWEENGYHDSYFYKAAWDAEKKEVVLVSAGATAYASCDTTPRPASPTIEVVEQARQWLKGYIKGSLREADKNDIEWPKSLQKGDRVVIKAATKKQFKVATTGQCAKCEGTGHWINPRNSSDKRSCFACQGTGQGRGKAEALTENGKKVYQAIPAGTKGTVVWSGQNPYRKVYRNGYNTVADISQALVRFDAPFERNGQKLEVAYFEYGQLALDRSPLTEDQIEEKAERLSFEFYFKPALSNHGGWLTRNLAKSVWERHYGQQG